MKLHGFVGGGTGKLGNSVFSQNAGRTIVRQYNPEVKNPNTARQQNSRARFTMAGDLAKNFATALAIGRPRVGALTGRNQFTKDIIPVSAGVINMVGSVLTPDYTKMPIAKGGMPMPAVVSGGASAGDQMFNINLSEAYNPTAVGYLPPMEGQAGLVAVVLNESTNELFINQFIDLALTDLDVPIKSAVAGEKYAFYVFAKWIPASHNDIATTSEPWRYPSDQSDSVCGGEWTIPE